MACLSNYMKQQSGCASRKSRLAVINLGSRNMIRNVALCFLFSTYTLLSASFTASVQAYNSNHPYLYLTQQQLDTLSDLVNSGAANYVTEAYSNMKAYGDARINDEPLVVPYRGDDPDLVHYRIGLTDTEKATAWAVSYNVEQDPAKKMQYAQKARNYVMAYEQARMDAYFGPVVSWSINMLIVYDLTFSSGLYSDSDIAKIQSLLRAGGVVPQANWCETDGAWEQNMSHWYCGLFALSAIMMDDQAAIDRAYAQFKRRINATYSDGRFHDYEHRNLAYNNFSLSPMLFAALAAKNTGRDWWGYRGPDGRSLERSVDFLASPAHTKNGNSWVPSIYGNLLSESAQSSGQNIGAYGLTLPQKVLSDQRFIFELALNQMNKPSYLDILNNSSAGKISRASIYNYHAHYWLPTFLNVDKLLADAPQPTPQPSAEGSPPKAPANLKFGILP